MPLEGYVGIILGLYRGYLGIMEKKMETLGAFKGICRDYIGLYRGYLGIMEKKMETLGAFKGICRDYIGVI